MQLDELWAERLPLYQATARCRRLPFYRDWRQPFFLGERRVAGLAALFFPPDPLPQALGLEPNWAEPVSWHVAGNGDDSSQLTLTPLYPDYGPARQPKLPCQDPVALFKGLGYELQAAPSLKIEGRILHMPDTFDEVDHLAEGMRAVIHNEWRRRDGKGAMGAELLFALIAPEIALNIAHLALSAATAAEWDATTPDQLAATSLQAAEKARDVLEDALGEKAAVAFTGHWDPPEPALHAVIPETLSPFLIPEAPA